MGATEMDCELAARFVKMVKDGLDATPDWETLVRDVLSYAGFDELGRIERKPVSDFREECPGSGVLEQYTVNPASGIWMTRSKTAGPWLDEVWRGIHAKRHARFAAVPESEIVQFVADAIERHRPLQPIVLTFWGEVLLNRPALNLMDRHPRDSDELPVGEAGLHAVCMGIIFHRYISGTYAALHCRDCGLRIVIPRTVVTYGDLRRHPA